MRVVGISRYGDHSVLEDWDVPTPRPGPGEALVKVHFAGVNFMDVHTRQGKYATSSTYRVSVPVTLGMEGAGEVLSVGEGVTEVTPGQRVAWCLSWGSYAELALVPVARLASVPDQIGLDLAAASIFQGCTAHYLVHDVAKLEPGMSCLVHAASGAIGQLLVQMACSLNVVVLATTSTVAKAEAVRRLGAQEVFSYDEGRFADRVRAATAGHGVDVVFDSLGAPTLRDSFRAAARRALVVSYGSVGGSLHDLDPIELGEAGSLVLTRPRLADFIATREELQRRANDVFAALEEGSLLVQLGEEFSLDTAAQAMERLETRRQIGKSLLRIAASPVGG